MAISIEGQKCPICGGYMFDEDDIVYCPQCGAPHHRECYLAKGSCGLEQYHGTDKQYKKPETAQKEGSQPIPSTPDREYKEDSAQKDTLCHACGKHYPSDQNVCPHCGNPAQMVYTPFGTPVSIDPLGGVMPQAKTAEGITATEIANYVAVNTPRYVPRFFKLNKKNKTSWNWGSFLFPHAWFFYRKIYFPGTLFFILSVAASVMTMAVNLLLGDLSFANTNEMSQYIMQNIETLNKLPIFISFAGVMGDIFVRITAALFGDWFYRQSALERIKEAKEDLDGDDEEKVRIRKKGSVNIFLGLLGLMGINWLSYFLFALI